MSDPVSDTGNIPSAMVEAGIVARGGHRAQVVLSFANGPGWECSCGDEAWGLPSEDAAHEAARQHAMRAILAAAFAECEVREEWRTLFIDPDCAARTYFRWVGSEVEARAQIHPGLITEDVAIERRLVVVTPAQES